MATESEYKKWTTDYMKSKSYSKEDIALISSVDTIIKYGDIPDIVGFNVGMICRLLSLGAPVREDDVVKLKTCISYLLEKAKNTKVEKIESADEPTISIQDRTNEKIRNIIGDLEKVADSRLLGEKVKVDAALTATIAEQVSEKLAGKKSSKKLEIKKPVQLSVKDILHNKQVKPNQCERIASWFRATLTTMDTDLNECPDCYDNYVVANFDNYKKFLEEIVVSCKQYAEANKTVVIRRRRKKSPVDICKKVKYKQEDSTLKVQSLSPTKIIGAEKVLLLNVKKMTATLLQSNTSQGLSIKGTTIIDFDTSKTVSYSKKVRKPAEFVKDIKDKGIRAVKNTLDSIKTTSYEAAGRLNEDIIILGVY